MVPVWLAIRRACAHRGMWAHTAYAGALRAQAHRADEIRTVGGFHPH
jgi:hypothetical protein